MKTILITLLIAVCISCSKSEEPVVDVVGKWHVTQMSNDGKVYNSAIYYNWYLSFCSDGVFVDSMDNDTWKNSSVGKYAISGNVITCKIPEQNDTKITVLSIDGNVITIKMEQQSSISVVWVKAEKQI